MKKMEILKKSGTIMKKITKGIFMSHKTIAILAAKRTPMGAFQGQLKAFSAVDLGGHAISGALKASAVNPLDVQEVMMGCVLPAGLGQAPARQAALKAGLPASVHAFTLNKVCGSGMKAVMVAYDQIMAGCTNPLVAGGMESMTNSPYLLNKGRMGYRMGHAPLFDHMMLDGLEDAYAPGTSMGVFAEHTATRCGFNRHDQDDFAIHSAQKALKAQENGCFDDEIITLQDSNGTLNKDEPPLKVKFEKISNLKPAFKKDGTITAASSSSIADGASALVLMEKEAANEKGYDVLATLCGHASHSQDPEWFTLAPIGAIQKLLDKLKWTADSVDLYEINEAFAVVSMAAVKELGIQANKVNIHGGACALGHPLGATGARIIVTLIHALRKTGKKRGIAALCIGGGEATAVGIEI